MSHLLSLPSIPLFSTCCCLMIANTGVVQLLFSVILCQTGDPKPSVKWWRKGKVFDDSHEIGPDGIVRNELEISRLSSEDLLSVLTCQASNTASISPLEASILIDITSKWIPLFSLSLVLQLTFRVLLLLIPFLILAAPSNLVFLIRSVTTVTNAVTHESHDPDREAGKKKVSESYHNFTIFTGFSQYPQSVRLQIVNSSNARCIHISFRKSNLPNFLSGEKFGENSFE